MSTNGLYSWIGFLDKLNFSTRIYRSIEDDFLRFLDFVPLEDQNFNVHSPKLLTLILNIGPELLSIFDSLVFTRRYKDGLDDERLSLLEKKVKLGAGRRSLTFLDYFNFLGKTLDFEKAEVVAKDLHRNISPFLTEKEERVPAWWDCYNRVRHDKYSHYREATLEITLHGLGAMYYLVQYGHDLEGDVELKSPVFERAYPRITPLSTF